MSVREWRDDRAAKRARRRMPTPSEFKMGTRAHESDRYEEDDDELEVDRCVGCMVYYSVIELNQDGLCDKCAGKEEESENELTE